MRSPGYPSRIVGREKANNLGNLVLAEALHTNTRDKRLLTGSRSTALRLRSIDQEVDAWIQHASIAA
jgi:hypothetical protein